MGSEFANRHLLHALMKFYIEAESTGSHTQFFDKFNIRYVHRRAMGGLGGSFPAA